MLNLFDYDGWCAYAEVLTSVDVSGAWELHGSDGIREEGSGIMLCLGPGNTKVVGSVWSLPASPPRCHWGRGVDAGFHVQLLEPDRTNCLSVFMALEETDKE